VGCKIGHTEVARTDAAPRGGGSRLCWTRPLRQTTDTGAVRFRTALNEGVHKVERCGDTQAREAAVEPRIASELWVQAALDEGEARVTLGGGRVIVARGDGGPDDPNMGFAAWRLSARCLKRCASRTVALIWSRLSSAPRL
jgi:hypothetical protein